MISAPQFAARSFAEVQRLIKIGYVDVERVFDRYPGTDDIRERLRTERERYEAEINKRKEEIARLELDYQQNLSRLTADERMRRESEISYKKELLAEYIEQANTALDT
jgi:Skp family chaperone for outer membrane proteins